MNMMRPQIFQIPVYALKNRFTKKRIVVSYPIKYHMVFQEND